MRSRGSARCYVMGEKECSSELRNLSRERGGCGERRGLLGWETVEGSMDRCRRSDGVNTHRGEKEVRVSDFRGGGMLAGDYVWGVAMGVGGQDTEGCPSWASRTTERLGCGLGHSWTLKSSWCPPHISPLLATPPCLSGHMGC